MFIPSKILIHSYAWIVNASNLLKGFSKHFNFWFVNHFRHVVMRCNNHEFVFDGVNVEFISWQRETQLRQVSIHSFFHSRYGRSRRIETDVIGMHAS